MEKICQAIKQSLVKLNKRFWLWALSLVFLLSSLGLFRIYFNYYQTHFYPEVYVDDVAIGGLTHDEARLKLDQIWKEKQKNLPLSLSYDAEAIENTRIELMLTNNFAEQLERASLIGHQGNYWQKIWALWQKHHFYTQAQLDQTSLMGALATLSERFDQAGRVASAKLASSGNAYTLSIDAGENGRQLQFDPSVEMVQQQLNKSWLKLEPADLQIVALVASTSAQLNPEQIEAAKERAKKLVGQNLVFTGEYQRAEFSDQDLISLLRFPDGINQDTLDENLLTQLVTEKTNNINRPAQNASFQFHRDDNQQIIIDEFVPDLKGLKVDETNLIAKIKQAIVGLENEQSLDQLSNDNPDFFALTMTSTEAEITLGQTNDFGIEEIIGFGESWYFHSIPSRIHNVSVASEKMNLTLIPPGEEFSFNRSIGDVSTATGYQTAYIIQNGATELAPGGGVCQVSSTLFRALLDAGVKITRRLAHSYRVSYYEINNDPGFDATVFSGNTDLRFINDTPGYLLLTFEADPENLYMTVKIYGSDDGRSTEIINYKKWGYTSAPPPVYIPDPSLPSGKLKQIDWASSGIKAEFSNVIKDKDGAIIREDYYYSNYQPWSAKYLQGI